MEIKRNKKIEYEENVTNVLHKDGIKEVEIQNSNLYHFKSSDYKKKLNDAPWADRIIYNNYVSAVLICQKPGEGNRTHYHEVDDEWWVVLAGKIKWWIEGFGEFVAETGDIVFAEHGRQHKIRTIGEETSIRLAISPPDIPHFHPVRDEAPDSF